MWQSIGLALTLIFLVLVVADPRVCPDGCREQGVQMAPAAPVCVICVGLGAVVGGFQFEPVESFLPQAVVVSLQPEQLVPHPIEHPPQRT